MSSISRTAAVVVVAITMLVASACASSTDVDGVVVASGLDGPTQLAIADDGAWFVAQLAGGENDGTGQVVRIDPDDADAAPDVVLSELDKPTGVAIFADRLWVLERTRLIRAELDGSGVEVVIDDMVFNGRSEGSLTVDGDRLLFQTSGRISERTPEPVDPSVSSGVLWAIDGSDEITPVAWGLKHAYTQTRDENGVLWTTELADGTYDGAPARDEVVAVVEGADHGWPRCVGDNRAVAEFDGTAATCASVPRSQAVFELRATPTGLAVAPWDPTLLLVALWFEGQVVAVSIDPAEAPVAPTVVYSFAERPQDLVADGDRVLMVDHARGEIVELVRG